MKNVIKSNESTVVKLRQFLPRGLPPSLGQLRDSLTPYDTGDTSRFLVYIPDVIMDERNNTHYIPFSQHPTKTGDDVCYYTCIKGIAGERYTDIRNTIQRVQGEDYVDLAYDESCPLCDVQGKVWEGYNAKYKHAVEKRGVNLKDSEIKKLKQDLVRDLPVRQGSDNVIFPIILIPVEVSLTGVLPEDWLEKCEVLMVLWHKNLYDQRLIDMLSNYRASTRSEDINFTTPTGLLWEFFYEGDARDIRNILRSSLHIPVMPHTEMFTSKYVALDKEKKKLDALACNYMKDKKDGIVASLYAPMSTLLNRSSCF